MYWTGVGSLEIDFPYKYQMRDLINLIEQSLQESVTFHPSVLKIIDGEKHIEYPQTGYREIQEPCPGCEYHKEWLPNWDSKNCEDCGGTGFWTERVYNFPELNVSNFQVSDIADMLGFPDEDSHGWISPEELPQVMRRLIKLKNGDSSDYTHDGETTGGDTYVDHSGDVPAIRKKIMIHSGGRNQAQIDRYIDRLIGIVRWAQEHHCGISWA